MAEKEKKVLTLEEKMSRIWTIWNIVEAVILLAAGVLAILFGAKIIGGDDASHGTANLILGIVIGAFIILDGILRFIMGITKFREAKNESTNLISAFEISIGVTIIMMHEVFLKAAIYFIATLLITVGVLMIIDAVSIIIKKLKTLYIPILTIIFAALLVGLGITIYVLYNTDNESFEQVVNIAFGIVLILVGAALAILTLVHNVKSKKEKDGKKAPDTVKTPDGSEVKEAAVEDAEPSKSLPSNDVQDAEVSDPEPQEEGKEE